MSEGSRVAGAHPHSTYKYGELRRGDEEKEVRRTAQVTEEGISSADARPRASGHWGMDVSSQCQAPARTCSLDTVAVLRSSV